MYPPETSTPLSSKRLPIISITSPGALLALTDALGNLVRFELLSGQRHDMVGVAPLMENVAFGGLIADRAFDAGWILAELDALSAQVVVSQHRQRAKPPSPDRSTQTSTSGVTYRELLLQAQ